MLRCVPLRLASLALLASLAGCAFNFLDEGREAWRDEAEQACYAKKLVVPTYFQKPARGIEGRGACGIEQPLNVNAFMSGGVSVGGSEVVLGCMMTYKMERWMQEAVQPAAYQRFGVPVTEVLTMGTYACRNRNNRHGEKLSEHAFANAFDVAGFRLADGRTIRVKGDWRRGDPATQAFLREAHGTACRYFTTVLGPGSNRQHEDHIHIDLARHNARGSSYCRPTPMIPPPTPPDPYQNMPMANLPAGAAPAATAVAGRPVTYQWGGETAPPEQGSGYPAEPAPAQGPYTPPANIPMSYAPAE